MIVSLEWFPTPWIFIFNVLFCKCVRPIECMSLSCQCECARCKPGLKSSTYAFQDYVIDVLKVNGEIIGYKLCRSKLAPTATTA